MVKAVIFDMFETLITHYETPLYFSAQMAADAGIEPEHFLPIWHATEQGRTIGKLTLEQVLATILRENQRYSENLLKEIVEKRIETKRSCFRHMHPEIIPMLSQLKEKGIFIGLISNCFSEEAKAIRESELFPYFDAVCLSWEQGIQKPDKEIFEKCTEMLSVTEEECLYVGDGGSYELETAKELGMTAVQAAWYLKEGLTQLSKRKPDFTQLETPLDVLRYLLKEK